MARKREAVSVRVRFEVFKRDNFMCRYCGRRPPEVELALDHLIAVAAGGTNDAENLVCSCVPCNAGKSDRPVTESALPATVDEATLAALARGVQLQREAMELHRSREAMIEELEGEVTSAWYRTIPHASPPTPHSIRSIIRDGVPMEVLFRAVAATGSKASQPYVWSFKQTEAVPYFFGCVRNMNKRGAT